ncbi:MAG: hypothetical protein E3J29_01830, partial [Dehalococcoidia bacterium]
MAPRPSRGRDKRAFDLQAAGQPLTEYRRYYLHGVFLLLAFIAVALAATGVLGRVARPFVSADAAPEAAVAESPSAGYLRPPIVLATSPGIYIVNPEPEPQEAAEEATPEAEPT